MFEVLLNNQNPFTKIQKEFVFLEGAQLRALVDYNDNKNKSSVLDSLSVQQTSFCVDRIC
jgi:hypothetical protein